MKMCTLFCTDRRTLWAGSLKKNTTLEYSTRVVQEGDRRCKKSTLNDLAYLTPLRIPLMNPVFVYQCTLWSTLHYDDDVLTRLVAVHFARFYNCKGDIENTGSGNTVRAHRGIRTMPKELQSITLVSIILPKSAGRVGWGSMFFYFDGSLIELAVPSAGAEMLSCELLSNHCCQILPGKKIVNAGMPEKSIRNRHFFR
jgi:hypothetical protein